MNYEADKEKFPDALDEFTLELMIGIVGEENMFFESEIIERRNKQYNIKNPKPSIKDRLESAKAKSESKSQCKKQEKNFCEER